MHDVGHLVDFMPTFAELAGVDVPATFQGRDVLPAEGQSLAGLLGEEATTPVSRELYWIIGGARAMRQGKWKLVTEGPERVQAGIPVPAGHEAWGLYDMEADRCELYNLADRHPDRVRTMSSMWEAWRERTLADTGV